MAGKISGSELVTRGGTGYSSPRRQSLESGHVIRTLSSPSLTHIAGRSHPFSSVRHKNTFSKCSQHPCGTITQGIGSTGCPASAFRFRLGPTPGVTQPLPSNTRMPKVVTMPSACQWCPDVKYRQHQCNQTDVHSPSWLQDFPHMRTKQ